MLDHIHSHLHETCARIPEDNRAHLAALWQCWSFVDLLHRIREIAQATPGLGIPGAPGATRTRDPQLRRLFRESCNLPVLLRYSENLVRSRSAMRCQEVP